MPPLDEIAPGLWRYTLTRNGAPPTMTAYALRNGARALAASPARPPLAGRRFAVCRPLNRRLVSRAPVSRAFADGPCWTRTSDLGIKSPLLYQLS
jgi:hypothetical protein